MSSYKPATRAEFKAKVLRTLGSPVISINVSDDQIEDCIEEALQYYADYHYDGSALTYLKYQMTSTDVTNQYVIIPENIIGVKNIFPMGVTSTSSTDMFSPAYQLAFSMLPDMANMEMISYYMMKMQYAQIAELLIGRFPIRYNRNQDKLYLDCSPERLSVGDYIIIECYMTVDPDIDTDMWNDRMLKKHATALVKKIWGSNMSKYDGVQLPGGMTMNGRDILNDAIDELSQITDEYRSGYTLPAEDMIL